MFSAHAVYPCRVLYTTTSCQRWNDPAQDAAPERIAEYVHEGERDKEAGDGRPSVPVEGQEKDQDRDNPPNEASPPPPPPSLAYTAGACTQHAWNPTQRLWQCADSVNKVGCRKLCAGFRKIQGFNWSCCYIIIETRIAVKAITPNNIWNVSQRPLIVHHVEKNASIWQ